MGLIDAKLAAMGIVLPTPMAPVANYVPFVISGDIVVVSGQLPMRDGALVATGKLGDAVSVETGTLCAHWCFINLMAQLRVACGGDLDRVAQVIRLGGYIASVPSFTAQAGVMNGASNLAVEVFGDAGRHARTTIGVPVLPLDAAVEVEGVFRIA